MRVGHLLLVVVMFCTSALAALPDSFSGDGLTVRFTTKAENDLRGTLNMGGHEYPFTAARSGDAAMAGTFTAGGQAYKFTLTADGAGAVFETDGTKYRLAAGAGGGGAPQPPQPPPVLPNNGRRGPSMTYVPTKIFDAKTQMDVAMLLVPQGWQVEPGVWWRAKYAQFVTLTTTVYDPASGWALRWIPYDQFIVDPTLYQNAINQNTNPMTIGGIEYTPQPMTAVDYVQAIVLPRYRKIQGLRVAGAQDLPQLAQVIDMTQPTTRQKFARGGRQLVYSAARVRVEYPGPGGKAMEEDIFCVLNISWDPVANAQARSVGMPAQQFILCDRLYGYTAPKGELAVAAGYLDKIFFSMRPYAEWMKFIDNIQSQVDGIALNEYAMLKAKQQEITDSQRKTVEDTWKSADKQSDQVGVLLGGSEWRNNPHGGPPVRGTAGNNTWVRPNGEQKELPIGENPNDDPQSTKDWKLAKTGTPGT